MCPPPEKNPRTFCFKCSWAIFCRLLTDICQLLNQQPMLGMLVLIWIHFTWQLQMWLQNSTITTFVPKQWNSDELSSVDDYCSVPSFCMLFFILNLTTKTNNQKYFFRRVLFKHYAAWTFRERMKHRARKCACCAWLSEKLLQEL